MENEKESGDVVSLEVSAVIQTFIDKLVALDRRVEKLEATTALLCEGYHLLGQAAKGQEKIIEAIAKPDEKPEKPRDIIPPGPGTVN